MLNRFGRDGLYLLDEPEAALSTQNCLTCLRRIHELVLDGSQFVIATHSPIVLAYPEATIYSCDEHGLPAGCLPGRQARAPHAELPRRSRALLGPLALRLTRRAPTKTRRCPGYGDLGPVDCQRFEESERA